MWLPQPANLACPYSFQRTVSDSVISGPLLFLVEVNYLYICSVILFLYHKIHAAKFNFSFSNFLFS
jgi:hypothetical protein